MVENDCLDKRFDFVRNCHTDIGCLLKNISWTKNVDCVLKIQHAYLSASTFNLHDYLGLTVVTSHSLKLLFGFLQH